METTANKLKLTNQEQVAVLQNLSQQAAAWLVGCTSRTLRDRSEIPRHNDGTYDGQELVKWAASRMDAPVLDDDQYESLLTMVEWLSAEPTAPYFHGADQLWQEYGDAGLYLLGRMFYDNWRKLYETYPDDPSEPASADLNRVAEKAKEEYNLRYSRSMFRIATVCRECEKLRRGRKWIRESPPADFYVVTGLCPTCDRKRV